MPAIDVNALVGQLTGAVNTAIGQDVTQVQGFAQAQMQALAQQGALVASGIASGQIGPDLEPFFLDSLKTMARNLVNVLKGLAAVMLEKAWNALVGALWSAIGGAIGRVLPA
ncbi:hypothetical protein V6B08_16080 [Ferrovibrio sp. MS7]|jgi:hypothetical protein|uniref:hypothetical protein n=1 Tax=Ferrovibrio plantarum TaxID=3119164 RepID=UPI001B787529|nr:hypothetical protein [Ferrovibrio sp.]